MQELNNKLNKPYETFLNRMMQNNHKTTPNPSLDFVLPWITKTVSYKLLAANGMVSTFVKGNIFTIAFLQSHMSDSFINEYLATHVDYVDAYEDDANKLTLVMFAIPKIIKDEVVTPMIAGEYSKINSDLLDNYSRAHWILQTNGEKKINDIRQILIKGEHRRKEYETSLGVDMTDKELYDKYSEASYAYDYTYVPTENDILVDKKLREANDYLTHIALSTN